MNTLPIASQDATEAQLDAPELKTIFGEPLREQARLAELCELLDLLHDPSAGMPGPEHYSFERPMTIVVTQ